jgi:translocation and assembly module TamB
MPLLARRWVKWLLAGLAAFVVLLLSAFAWLVTTEAGLRRAVSMLESVGSVKIHVDGARGRLIGPLAIESIEIEHPRAKIRVAGLSADYEPSELFAGRISAESAVIADARVELRRAPASTRPPSFMPGWLDVVVDGATVKRLVIVAPGGEEVPFTDIRGSARISKSRLAFDGVHMKSTGWAVAGASGTLFARSPLGLDVTTAWSLGDGNQVAGIVRAAGNLDRTLADAQVAAPGIGRAKVELTDIGPDLAFRGDVDIATLDLVQWIAAPPFGPLQGKFAVEGDRAHYRAKGSVSGTGLPEDGVPVSARASYADRVLKFESIELEPGADSRVAAQGTMRLAGAPAYDVTADWTGFRWPLTGRALIVSPRGHLVASGWTEFDWRVNGAFEPADAPPFAGEAAGRFTAAAIEVRESAWQALGGRIALAASLGRDAAQRWSVSGRASGIDPSTLRKDLPGKLSFGFSGAGSGFDARGPWNATITRLTGTLRGQPASGGGTIRRGAERTEFQRVAFALGPARLEADGALGKGATLDARVLTDDLSALLPEAAGRLDATVAVREHEVAIAVSGRDLAYGSHRAVALSVDAHVDRDGREHSWLRLRSSGITVAGFPVTDTRLSLDGLPHDHALTFRIGSGQDSVSMRGRGAWVDGRYTLAFESIDANGPRLVPWHLEKPSRLAAGRESGSLEPLCVVYDTRRICIEGRWQPEGQWSLKARTEAFPLEALDTKRLGAPRFRGLIAFDAEASGGANAPWLANVNAALSDASLLYKSASGADRTAEFGDTRVTLVSDAAQHRLDLKVSDAEDLDLSAHFEAERIPGKAIGDLPLAGTVRGRTRQLTLLPLLVDTIDNASGELALDFTVAGQVAKPILEGEARLTRGTLDFYQANLRLRELSSTVRLKDTSLTLDAEGKAGDGTLGVNGRVGWRDRKLEGELHLTGDRLLVANVPEARVLASPDLRFTLDDHRIDVSGSVVIPEAAIQPADTAGAVLVSGDEEIVRPESGPDADKRFEVTSEVRIALGDKVKVKAYGLSAEVTGAVATQTAPRESTTGTGELEVKTGKYSAYGRELEVERGKLLFTGGPVSDPGVDLRATRELPGYKVGVIARGPLRKPQLTLFSEPSLSQSQIASMLIVGRSSIQSDPGAADTNSLSTTEQGGAFLAGQLGKYVGLDDIGVTQDADTGTEFVIGKYLSPRLYVSYGISLVEEINTLKLRYTIGDRWTVSAESGQEQAMDIEYRIED